MLGQGRESPQAEALVDELARSVEDFEPGTSGEQALYTQGLTVVVVLVLYTIYRLDYPFSGAVRVGPDAFELMLQEIEDDSER